MRTSFCHVAVLSLLVVMTACSRPRPSAKVLTEAIAATLPGHLAVECKNYQFSPLREVLGTTLPEGSYQIDIETVVKAKEALYFHASHSPLRRQDLLPDEVRAQIEGDMEMAQWSWGAHATSGAVDGSLKNAPLQGFLVLIAKAREEKKLWTKLVAEPRGSEWLVTIVEGEPGMAFSAGQPMAAFKPGMLIYASEEQRRNRADVKAAYDQAMHDKAILAKLAPNIEALMRGEHELANRYENEVREVAKKVIQESRAAFSEHGDRLTEIIRIGSAANDDGKTRDRLIKVEVQRSELEQKAFDDRIEDLERQQKLARKRAHTEIEAKIRELKLGHGLRS